MAHSSSQAIHDLVLKHADFRESDTILVMSAEDINLIEALGDIVSQVCVHDVSHHNLLRLQGSLQADHIHIMTTPYPQLERQFDAALLFVSKGRDFTRANLVYAAGCVQPGGKLVIVGANDGGVKSVIADTATLLGSCNLLAYKKSHRIASSIIPTTLRIPDDWQHVAHFHNIPVHTRFGKAEVISRTGVFSWNELDAGTAFLLEHLSVSNTDSVLDLGCGSGVIGASIAHSAAAVLLTDENLLAVDCARRTLEHNGLTNCRTLASDGYEQLSGQRFDLIVSNPPFHQQFEVNARFTERMILEAPAYLTRGGRLVIVANAFLRYEPLFEQAFKKTVVIARNNRYKIIEGSVSA